MPAPSHSGKPRAEALLQAATWLKWIRDNALNGRPGLPASTDELNDVIKILEDLAWHGVSEDQV